MLQKVLIANRGEIACRIMRTAERLAIATVAVYSDADAGALHVDMADEAVHIGPGPASQSYLQIDKIIAAARETGADCVHPGYGFLAEAADFAAACATAGLTFIGPSPQAMRALGGKAAAKQVALQSGVPVVPGYQGDAQDLATLIQAADDIGYPVMIKAIAGGGGRGMRLVSKADQFADALESAQREALGAFGEARVLIEKYIQRPRHIEVQVFGDSHGNVVHLFERDCTLQRRHQKVIEEAPAPGMSDALRRDMTTAAVRHAQSVGYEGAGTVEFLVEGGNLKHDAPWYFIEMNTRLQVEHTVTEEITGLDLVEWQFRIAAGEALPLEQDDIAFGGHAIEVRLCAEDPNNGFAPSIGKIDEFDILEDDGLRIESGIGPDGGEISPYYDSMIAKIIRVGLDRETVIDDLRVDLQDVEILGVKTNLAFLYELLGHDAVHKGAIHTGLIEENLAALTPASPPYSAIAEGTRALMAEQNSAYAPHARDANDPFNRDDAFQLGGARNTKQQLFIDGQPCSVELTWMPEQIAVTIDGIDAGVIEPDLVTGEVISDIGVMAPLSQVDAGAAHVLSDMQHVTVSWPVYDVHAIDMAGQGNTVRAPINGRIARIMVKSDAHVEKGDTIAVVEAMKMEHVLTAPCAGRIAQLYVGQETQVTQGTVIVSIETEETA
ncbi:MAG: biotin carboxylase N-terminal domain-containing protein [Pseudomonadota bacterium]